MEFPCKTCLMLPICINKLRRKMENFDLGYGYYNKFNIFDHYIFNTLTIYCTELGRFQVWAFDQPKCDIITKFYMERFKDE